MKQIALIVIVIFVAAIIYLSTKPSKDITLKDMIKYNAPKAGAAKRNHDPVFLDTVTDNISGSDSAGGSVNVNIDPGNDKSAGKVNTGNEVNEVVAVKPGSEKICYYLIIESSKNLKLAQERAKKLEDSFKSKIIVLPPTPEGYCRLSYGKYSTREEAESAISTVKQKVGTNVWILSVKK